MLGEGAGSLVGVKIFDQPNIPNTPTDRALLLWVTPEETANQIETKERRDGLSRKRLATQIAWPILRVQNETTTETSAPGP